MKCDFAKFSNSSTEIPCHKEATQFMLTIWKNSRLTENIWKKQSSPKLIARCFDHFVVGVADRQDLVEITEEEAIVFRTHEE